MKKLAAFKSFLFLFSMSAGMIFLISGCVATKEKSLPDPLIQQYDELEKVNEQLAEELKLQRQMTAQLQMTLLAKHAEVNRLTVMNKHLVRDYVHNKSKVRNRGDKVETVRLLAEVTSLIDMVKENKLSGSRQALLARAEQYQTEGRLELAEGNFDAASYLAGQALKEIEALQLAINSNGQGGDRSAVHFVAPLPMVVLKGANVRKGPSLAAKVKGVLFLGTHVSAVGYQGEWVKVKMAEGGSGWIHYSLLRGARE